MIPMGPDWWGQSTEQDDRGQTIATLWMVGRFPLFAAGSLPPRSSPAACLPPPRKQ